MKSLPPFKCLASAAIAVSALLSLPLSAQQAQPGTNIALGKKVTLFPIPNSPEPGNKPEKLTDGNPKVDVITKEDTTAMWVQPGAVGWAYTNPAAIVVDLGSVQPISGFSYFTAAGISDVTWPTSIHMAVSDDEKTWRYAGDLVALSAKTSKPGAYGQFSEHLFVTRAIKAKGRYVAFGISSPLYITTNEVEVFAGDPAWLNGPDDTIPFPSDAANILDYMASHTVKQGQTKRVEGDTSSISSAIARSSLTEARKNTLLANLAAAGMPDNSEPLPTKDYKAIAPVNERHRKILAVQGELLAAQGYKPLTVWSQHRYNWLPLLATPAKNTKDDLSFSMLRNQFRAQSLLLTNASGAAQTVQLKLANAPKNAKPGWLQVDSVEWTDTHQSVVVADALVPLAAQDGAFSVRIPAGVTRKLWFTIDSSKLPAGTTKSSLAIQSSAGRSTVPFTVEVAPLAMKRPRISLGMWDDADSAELGGALGITMKNREAAWKLMRSHYVDTAWGKRPTLPWPAATDFDASHKLISTLDYSRLDKWIKDWPEARRFFNFIYAGHDFAGTKLGTPEFNERVASWAKDLSRHLKQIGFKPRQFGFMIVDEQRTLDHEIIVANWAKAIKTGAPDLAIFENPIWARPDKLENQDAIAQADIMSPVLPGYYRHGQELQDWYQNHRRNGKELWFYQCAGPVRLYDPQLYYRYQAWHVFAVGGTGQGFWSFGDIGNLSRTSWNDYANTPYYTYTPQFIDVDTMNSSVHWESVREGMEDSEELAMLRDAIAASKDAKLRTAAQKVLDDAVRAVTGVWKDATPAPGDRFSVADNYDWRSGRADASLADRHLRNVRAMLVKLTAK